MLMIEEMINFTRGTNLVLRVLAPDNCGSEQGKCMNRSHSIFGDSKIKLKVPTLLFFYL